MLPSPSHICGKDVDAPNHPYQENQHRAQRGIFLPLVQPTYVIGIFYYIAGLLILNIFGLFGWSF